MPETSPRSLCSSTQNGGPRKSSSNTTSAVMPGMRHWTSLPNTAVSRTRTDRAARHAEALHAYRHRLHVRMTPRWLDADIVRGMESLERALDRQPALLRPPYGIYSPWGLRTVYRAGLRPLLWSRWGKDWRGDTTP